MSRQHYILLTLFLLLFAPLYAQEHLTPLLSGPRQTVSQHAAKGGKPLELPFFDDFSNYSGSPSSALWQQQGGAWVDAAFATLPPTVGAVTLDAINADGVLYSKSSTEEPFPADTLTSLPIRLDSIFFLSPREMRYSDSVILSFFYLPGGGSGDVWRRSGDTPDPSDSLVLEFYNATTHTWHRAWSTPGLSVDTLLARTGSDWQYVYIPIPQQYLTKAFQFRFRNYCSFESTIEYGLVGNCDQWHIDYVQLGVNRRIADFYQRDIAFVSPAPSLLLHYQAMPARQFRASDMAPSVHLYISNRYSMPLYSKYVYFATDEQGNTLPGGTIIPVEENVNPYYPDRQYQTSPLQASPAIGFGFPASTQQHVYTITHVITEGLEGDDHQVNDTIRFLQHLENYYAYDDGSAENGYGVTSQSATTYIAVQFPLVVADTLYAVDLYFNRTRGADNESMGFFITVWDDNDGHPGSIIYQDQSLRLPLFDGNNRFVRYQLSSPLLVSGTIYVGISQSLPGIINLGFDRNCDASSRTYYNIGGKWTNTYYPGALMLRPYFGKAAVLSAPSVDVCRAPEIYPNPCHHILHVKALPPCATLSLCDIFGHQLLATSETSFSVASLRPGVYLLYVVTPSSRSLPRKVIVK